MRVPSRQLPCFMVALVVAGPGCTAAESLGRLSSAEFFTQRVQPILHEHCASCHSEARGKIKGGLSLDSLADLMLGGNSGEPLIVPHDPKASLLISAVSHADPELSMPPSEEEPLTAADIAVLEEWITRGGYWPENSPAPAAEKYSPGHLASDWWAFQPVRKPDLPDASPWARSEIDRFIAVAHKEKGLVPAPPAPPHALARRLHLDLVGLPPTPAEVAEFVEDHRIDSRGAISRLVDRLLSSPRYGERWGRHWLDVARYADTQGEVADMPIEDMWKYRDWVIAAINRDLPFDEFLRQQLAGDIYAKSQPDISPQDYRNKVVATGFISVARRYGTSRDDIHLTIEDTLDTLGRGVVGLTLRCARCHDHKFDPIGARDYYALYGIFESTRYPWSGTSNLKMPVDLVSLEPGKEAEATVSGYWSRLDSLTNQVRKSRKQQTAIELHRKHTELSDAIAAAMVRQEDTGTLVRLQQELVAELPEFADLIRLGLPRIKQLREELGTMPPPVEMGFAVSEREAPRNARIHRNGDPARPGAEVPRGFVEVIAGPEARAITEGSGRRELAEWLTDPGHPLTARVFVNRVWQHHFGRGLVATSDNFGRMGELPSHPELLDWLAATFVEDGWSLKRLHRRIVLSQTYQLSSDGPTANEEIDPDNRYLWRHVYRLADAEVIRDSLLYVSGQLELNPPGRHPFPPLSANNFARYSLNRPFSDIYPTNARSVYLMTPRLRPHPALDLFNGPDRNASTTRRTTVSLPSQALFLLNSDFMGESAASLATLLSRQDDPQKRLRLAFNMLLSRDPSSDEVARLEHLLEDTRQASGNQADPEAAAWTALARVLLISNEFLFVP